MNKDTLRRILPTPILGFLKSVRCFYRAIFIFLETKIAPFIAFKMTFLIRPLYKFCEARNFCFIANIPDSDGVGHILVETDDFLRRQFLNELDRTKKYILIKKSHWLSKEYLSLYKYKFHFAICSSFLYYLTLPLIMRYETIRIDCGLSRTKWHPINNLDLVQGENLPSWPKTITKHKNLSEWAERYRRRARSSNFFPLKDFNTSVSNFLEPFRNQKIALIHIKTNVGNATAKVTNPYTYLQTIEYLLDLKYKLIFFGREKIPELFNKYKLFNYSESKYASFTHDIQLFNIASLAIMGGSGAFLFAECMNVDLLYINYWHLFRLPAAHSAICIPSLVRTPSKNFLKFSEQWKLYKNAQDGRVEVFPFDQFEARNATSDEILAGCQELINLKETQSPLQIQFARLSDYYFGESRISDYFIKKHESLL